METNGETSFSTLLDQLISVLARYVVMPAEERLVTALWIVQAHCFQHFEFSGYLAISSPEKQCGKTTLLELNRAAGAEAVSVRDAL